MLSLNYLIFKGFRKTIDKVTGISRQTEVISQIDNRSLVALRQCLHKRLRLPMPGAKKQHIGMNRPFDKLRDRGKPQLRLTEQVSMRGPHRLPAWLPL